MRVEGQWWRWWQVAAGLQTGRRWMTWGAGEKAEAVVVGWEVWGGAAAEKV